MNRTFFLPEIKLPRIEISNLNQPTFLGFCDANASYIPGISTLVGAADILIGTAKVASALALAVLFATLLPIVIIGDLLKGNPIFGTSAPGTILAPLSTFFGKSILASFEFFGIPGITQISLGIIKSIPIAGNIALAFYDGKIRIILT